MSDTTVKTSGSDVDPESTVNPPFLDNPETREVMVTSTAHMTEADRSLCLDRIRKRAP